MDKKDFSKKPSSEIQKIIKKISVLGSAIVAVRGDGFSANLLGGVKIGKDGGDPVLSFSNCDCHIHIEWNKVQKCIVDSEDVGYGPEPVIKFIDRSGGTIISLFYPGKSLNVVKKTIE